ncbi:hypothetical protein BRC81_14850 [Halobacteriales archaeon QS_1_68_20]|nr:MAG: hypothetical protein BRC81_14850 [Halobacteriales archaeon QS_1_68_20]
MDVALRRWLLREFVLAALAALTAVALISAGLSQAFAVGAAAGAWLAVSLVLYGPGVPPLLR